MIFGFSVASILAGVGACCMMPSAVHYPSIIMITVDTTRADHLGCYGYYRDTSPCLDQFSKDAILFERATTPIATTLPAHVSLFTSKYPMETGIVTNGMRIEDSSASDIQFFAEMLDDLGYETVAFVSATPLRERTGINAGFDYYHEPPDGTAELPADWATNKALGWLEDRQSRGSSRPLFLWVHYFDPHLPYAPPPPFDERFEADDQLIQILEKRGIDEATDPKNLDLHDRYDGEIAFLDTEIGRLFDRLREIDLYDHAAVVVAGDHGEGLMQHGWSHHGRIYNEQLFVPLLMKMPLEAGVNPQRRSDLVSLVDVVPTLLSALDLPVEEPAHGFRGIDLLEGKKRDHVFAQRTFVERVEKWGPGKRFALITTEWKYLHAPENEDVLYDMRVDSSETQNVIAKHPDIARRLRDQILTMIAKQAITGGFGVSDDISAEAADALRRLGYICE